MTQEAALLAMPQHWSLILSLLITFPPSTYATTVKRITLDFVITNKSSPLKFHMPNTPLFLSLQFSQSSLSCTQIWKSSSPFGSPITCLMLHRPPYPVNIFRFKTKALLMQTLRCLATLSSSVTLAYKNTKLA